MKDAPLVTLHPAVWRRLVAQATGHAREGGGLLIGRRVRGGGFHVLEEIGMTHVDASDAHIHYEKDEMARARKAAYDAYGPKLEPIGMWHTHPWASCSVKALSMQITLVEDGPGNDLEDMLVDDIEVICSTFPDPGYKPRVSEFEIRRKLGGVWCRAEAWLRVNGEAKPCRLQVRKVR